MDALQRRLAIFARSHHPEHGQGLAEYALILALIATVAIVAVLFLGSQISNQLNVIGTSIESVR